MDEAAAAREISYAHGARTAAGRLAIRALEALCGRAGLLRRARGYGAEVAAGACFWEVMTRRYGVRVEVASGALGRIPAEGPVVVVANHPFGVLDGMAMGWLLARARPGFKVLAHQVFHRAPDLRETILPIRFEETREALAETVATRRAAHAHLAAGGCLAVFPGGTVSTAARPFGHAIDPEWKTFTAQLIRRSRAQVVPVFFEGANSRLFQVASHAHMTLRLGLLIREFGRRVDGPVRAHVGAAISPEALARFDGDARGLMAHLRAATYGLSPRRMDDLAPGRSFD